MHGSGAIVHCVPQRSDLKRSLATGATASGSPGRVEEAERSGAFSRALRVYIGKYHCSVGSV